MLFEDIAIFLLLAAGVFLIGIPLYKLVRAIVPDRRNPLEEAKENLERVRVEVEAAKLNKEVEKLYSSLYEETLEEEKDKEKKI